LLGGCQRLRRHGDAAGIDIVVATGSMHGCERLLRLGEDAGIDIVAATDSMNGR